jgi:type IV fimbrial biogenesis protein FimT
MERLRAGKTSRPRWGVTVIEMMVVVAVLAVILALAVPSMRDFMARQRVKAINAELVTDLQYARSEAVARNQPVIVTFRREDLPGQPPMTCYTVHTQGTWGQCDCRKPLGTACLDIDGNAIANLVELKTVQVPGSTTVAIQAPIAPAHQLSFFGLRGLSVWEGHHFLAPNYVTDWVDYVVAVESSVSGRLRTATHITGRPTVCSPDGSISGVTPCP